METLAKLFGSETKVKLMRLFLFNPEIIFTTTHISTRVQAPPAKVRRELGNLEKAGLVKSRSAKGKKGFTLDPQFTYLSALQNFLVSTEPLHDKEIIRRLNKLGKISLIIVAGVFTREPESRADILIVGDNVKKSALDHLIKALESEIGKELKYAYFTNEDFKYRLSMFDKLVRDILDYPHRTIVNRLGTL